MGKQFECRRIAAILAEGMATVRLGGANGTSSVTSGCSARASEVTCNVSKAMTMCDPALLCAACGETLALALSRLQRLPHFICREAAQRCNNGGRCEADGTCTCALDAQLGRSWGGPSCAHANHAIGSDRSDPGYSEGVYGQYYRGGRRRNTTLTQRLRGGTRTSLSGPGSTLRGTEGVRTVLPYLIRLLGIKTMVDVPCGDLFYMRHILKEPVFREQRVHYVGADLVRSLVASLQDIYSSQGADGGPVIDFLQFDLATQMLWPADLVVVRDVLFHFDARRGAAVLRRISDSGAKWLLTTTYPTTNNRLSKQRRRFSAGKGFGSFWPANLQGPPFNLPPPLLAIGRDGFAGDAGRVVALWRLPLYPQAVSSL